MTLKMIQIGNSTGVIIPKVLLDKIGLKAGSQVDIEIAKAGTKSKLSSQVSNFVDILARVNKQYGPALEELANK